MSLRARLIMLVLLPAIPFGAVSFHLTDTVREDLMEHARNEMSSFAVLVSEELHATVEGSGHLVAALAQVAGIAEGDPVTCVRVFGDILANAPQYVSFFVSDAKGNMRCHSSEAPGSHNFSDRDYFRGARDRGRFTVGRPIIGRVTRRPMLPVALPLKDEDGRFRGIIFAGIDLGWVGDRFAKASGSSEYQFTAWADDGSILHRYPTSNRWSGKRSEDVGLMQAVLGRSEKAVVVDSGSMEGRPAIHSIVGTEDWSGSRLAFSVGIARHRLFAEAERYFDRSLLMLAVILAASAAAAYLIAEHGIRKKAVVLERAASRIAAGDLGARSGIHPGSDELARLAASFDRMADNLQTETLHLKLLSETGKALIRARSESMLLDEVCRVVVEHGGFRSCWVGYVEHDEGKTIRPVGQAGVSREFLHSLPFTWKESGLGLGAAGASIRSKAPTVAPSSMGTPAGAAWKQYAQAQDSAADAALPLEAAGELLGVMVISAQDRQRFGARDLKLLSELAAELVFGIRALRDRLQIEQHAAELASIVSMRTQQLASANRFLDSVVENIPDMIFVKDAIELRYVRLNRAAEVLLGPRDELIGKTDHDLFPRERADALAADDRKVLDGERLLVVEEEPLETRDQGRRLMHMRKFAVHDQAGRPCFLVGIGQDITERKGREREISALNVALQKRAGQLHTANRELEEFSHSVSHDLRAPLDAVRGFAEALRENHFDQLDEQARHFVDRIAAGAVRMDVLIGDLLSLSRVSRAELAARDVDLSAVAAEVMREISEREPARQCRVSIQPGMRAQGDANLLRIALTNLIANAWKFSGAREVAVIEVGEAGQAGGLREFFVRDNGAGFDPAHASKLFGTFQRLHAQSEFPGTGIGLAIVRRVIERHGGAVRAESTPGRGATFYFRLPTDVAPVGCPESAGATTKHY